MPPIRVVSHRCRGSREEDAAGSEREASKEKWGLAGYRYLAENKRLSIEI